jgi:GR25 family glycosyltransferase involved in LPS biosynthesis
MVLYVVILLIIIIIVILNFNSYKKEPFNNSKTIDAIVYINLEKRADRKDLLLKEFEKLNFPKDKIYRIAGVPIPKNGHKGCVQSHILALEMAKLNRWDNVAIFEDDFELTVTPDEFNRLIGKAFNYPKWDVIVLHGANQKIKKNIDDDMHYLKHSTQSTGYIINKSYIDILLNLFKKCNSKMNRYKWTDDVNKWEPHALDQKWNMLIKRDNWIGFKKNVGKQRDISSSINI